MTKIENMKATTALAAAESIDLLDNELSSIQERGAESLSGYMSGRRKLHEAMAATLALYFRAERVPGYLEQKYEDARIEYRKPKPGRINPTPWLKLSLGMDAKKHASMLSDNARSFAGLYEFFQDDHRRYGGDFGNIVFAEIQERGGLKFFRGEREKTEADLEREEAGFVGDEGFGDGKPSSASADAAGSARDTLLGLKLSTARELPARVTVPGFPGAVANDNGLITFVGRAVPGSSDVEIIAASGDDDLLEEVIINAVQPDLSTVSPVLRLLSEAMCTHAVPPKLDHLRAKYFDKSPSVMRRNRDGNLESVAISTWLLVDPEAQEIVVSKTPQAPTGITQVRPKSWTLHDGKPVVLMGSDKRFVERNLVAQGELAIWTADPADRLVSNTAESEKAGYCVDLATIDGSRTRRLHFHALDTVPNETNNGLRIPEPMPKGGWTIKASPQDFRRFADRTFGNWSAAVGPYINRTPNRFIGLQVTPQGIIVHWWYDKDRQRYTEHFEVLFDRGSTITLDGIPQIIDLAPKDAMPMFGGIASLPLATTEVLLRGTKDGLYIICETDLAHHRCYLPGKPHYDAWAEKERRSAKSRSAQASKAHKAKKSDKGGK